MKNTMKINASGRTVVLLSFIACIFLSVSCNKEPEGNYYKYQNKENVFSGNAYEYLKAATGTYDSMLLVIDRIEGLKDSLSNMQLTVFALPNLCFQTVVQNLNILRKSEGKTPLYLGTVDSSQLDTLICKYLIPGSYPTDSITFIDGVSLQSLKYGYRMHAQPIRVNASGFVNGGPRKLYFSDPKNSIYVRDWVRTTTQAVNIKTSNGVVHILTANHDFGFQEFVERMNH